MSGPICPWCGDETTERPEDEPFGANDQVYIECGGCGQPVVLKRVILDTRYEARKTTPRPTP